MSRFALRHVAMAAVSTQTGAVNTQQTQIPPLPVAIAAAGSPKGADLSGAATGPQRAFVPYSSSVTTMLLLLWPGFESLTSR